MDNRVPRVPPASKEVVANLPVITLTEDVLGKLGGDAECAICKENFVVDDKMQELPCKHTFHPPCLKPWLVMYLSINIMLSCDSPCHLSKKLGPFRPGRMSTIPAQSVGMNCSLMIMPMRAGRRGRRRQKKRGKELQMQFVGVNTCMFR